MRVDGIDHVNVLVKNSQMEAAMDFFCDVLGSRFMGPVDLNPRLPLRMAVDHRGFIIQSPTTPDHPFSQQLEKRGGGISSLAYRVPDINKGVAELKASGLKPMLLPPDGTEIVELPGLRSALFSGEGTFGVPIELVEYDAASPVSIANCNLTHEQTWYRTNPEPLLKVEWFDHIHVRVKDIEAAVSLFTKLFDAQFVFIDQRKKGLPMRVAFDKATQIEFLGPEKGAGVGDIYECIDRWGEGFDRAGFYVSNFKEGIKLLQSKGLKMTRLDPEIVKSIMEHGGINDIKAVTFSGENAFGFEIELVNYDVLWPVATAYLNVVSKLPWFKG